VPPLLKQLRRARRTRDPEGRLLIGALAGFVLCGIVFVVFFTLVGAQWWVGCLVLLLVLLLAVVLSRVRAEAGPAWAFGPYRDTSSILITGMGPQAFSTDALMGLSVFRWLYRDPRFLPMPFQLEALKIADTMGMRASRVVPLILLATLVGILAGCFSILTLSYHYGWSSGKVYGGPVWSAQSTWDQATSWANNRVPADTQGLPWIFGAALFTGFLMLMRHHFLWWPFHPIGYVMAETGTANSFWYHYVLAWTAKMLVLRYGGNRLYQRTLPFVIGVILGDVLSQVGWSLAGGLLNIPVYQFVS
jgi:hypothetical protein